MVTELPLKCGCFWLEMGIWIRCICVCVNIWLSFELCLNLDFFHMRTSELFFRFLNENQTSPKQGYAKHLTTLLEHGPKGLDIASE